MDGSLPSGLARFGSWHSEAVATGADMHPGHHSSGIWFACIRTPAWSDRQQHFFATGVSQSSSAETLQEHFSFVLVDAEKKNIGRAPLLETSHASYTAAVQCLNQLSPYYRDIDVAVERVGDDGMAPALLDCVLETSGDSALAQRLLQSGPADAQGQELEEEDVEVVAHATEEGAGNESNSKALRVLHCVCDRCDLYTSTPDVNIDTSSKI